MAYFQGGDFVELLSAQGKAPASTWKLQGKIVKAFDKSIKGNAFQMDGSSETKMQLPKTMTASSSLLGLSQRFLVFQLLVPHTRSFSVEVGFSDIQKIRRRLVFASAFREMALTTLHVQIPIGNNVSRDQWMNFVFDLQALTEHFFPGSSYRSMESICISGSCRLKRIFTMKDAPYCQAVQDNMQTQILRMKQQRLHIKDPSAVPTAVARFAEMKDIPKQFVFSAAPSSLPIPTEYFHVSFDRDGNSSPAETVVNGSSSKVIPNPKGGQVATKRSATSDVVKPKTAAIDRNGRSPLTGKTAAEGKPAVEARVASAASKRAATIQTDEQSTPAVRRNNKPRSSDSALIHDRSPAHFDVPSDDETADLSRLSPASSSRVSEEQNIHDEMTISTEQLDRDSRHRLRRSSSPCEQRVLRSEIDAAATGQRKQQRQHVLSEIQSKLNQLTKDAEDEEDRHREILLSKTSLGCGSPSSSHGSDNPRKPSLFVDAPQAVDTNDKSVHSSIDNWHESELLRSPEPMVLRRVFAAKKPEISFSSSIFAFDRREVSRAPPPDQDEDRYDSGSKTRKLFDWDSLLGDPVTALPNAGVSGTGGPQLQSDAVAASSVKEHPDLEAFRGPLSVDDSTYANAVSTVDEEQRTDPEVATRLTTTETTEALSSDTASEGIDTTSHVVTVPHRTRNDANNDLLESSFDFSLSLAKPNQDKSELTKLESQHDDYVSPRSGSEESFSFDVTDKELNLEEGFHTQLTHTSSSGSDNRGLDDEDSFDFGDLVVHGRNRSPVVRSRQQHPSVQRATDFARDATGPSRSKIRRSEPKSSAVESGAVPGNQAQLRTPNEDESSRTATVKTTASPLRKAVGKEPGAPQSHSRPSSSRAMSSSDRRLASLLESTDWSQLPFSSTVVSPESQRTKSDKTASRDKKAPMPTTNGAASTSLELIYDPILRCYYDPVGKKYYTLAK